MKNLKFDKITDQILSLGNEMRYVRIIDNKGQFVTDKIKKGKTLLQNNEGLGKFSSDLPIMKKMQQLFDEALGRTIFMHIVREKVHQFVYYADNLIFYVTCEPHTEDPRLTEISNVVSSIIQQSFR